MSNFLVSFKAGIDAAKQMERNKQEVLDTVRRISEEIFNATEELVNLGFTQRGTGIRESTWLVAIHSPSEGSTYKYIAKWEQDPTNGYPLVITLDHSSWHCSSADEIEAALSEIVQIPSVAVKFLDLMNVSETGTDLDPY